MGGRREIRAYTIPLGRCGVLAGELSQPSHNGGVSLAIRRLRTRAKAASSSCVTRAQSSMEFLLVMAFVFVLLTGIMFVAYAQSSQFSSDITSSQIQKVGNEIIDAVNTAYYAGPPTKKTITLYFPKNINAVTVNNQTIAFTVAGVGGNYEYAVYASTNMTGTLRTFSGLHTITVTAQEGIVNITDG